MSILFLFDEPLIWRPFSGRVVIAGNVVSPALCLGALRPGGRLVAHAVGEGEAARLLELQHRFGGQLTRIGCEVRTPSGWVPGYAVTRWALTIA